MILATIRHLESSGRYEIGPNRAGASGAYQFIPSTWASYAGYPEAYLAPPAVQDARARSDVERFLTMFDGRVEMVPVMWYYPIAASDPSWMDRVPNPAGGNMLTIREYQQRWLDVYTWLYASMIDDTGTTGAATGERRRPAAATIVTNTPSAARTGLGTGTVGAESANDAPTPAPTATTASAPLGGDDPAAVRLFGDIDDPPALLGAASSPTTAVAADPLRPTLRLGDLTLRRTGSMPDAGETGAAAVDSAGLDTTADDQTTLDAPSLEVAKPRPRMVRVHTPHRSIAVNRVTVGDSTLTSAARSMPSATDAPHGPASQRSIVFPVLGPTTYVDGWGAPRDGGARHHEGTDLIGVRMQPLLAAVDGTVVRLDHTTSGISGGAISIRDADGWRYNYFHLNNDTPGSDDGTAATPWQIAPGLQLGDTVRAGQVIGYMGDSGNAEYSVAHLHFELRDPLGIAQPSYWSLKAAEARQACTIGIGPWSTRSLGPGARRPVADRAVQYTAVTPLFGDGRWLIDTDGRVQATGDAALITPPSYNDCAAGPSVPFGVGGAGWRTERVDTSIFDGTVLRHVDLTETALRRAIPPSPDDRRRQRQLVERAAEPSTNDEPASAPTAGNGLWGRRTDLDEMTIAFRDPSTGETLVIVSRPLAPIATSNDGDEATTGRRPDRTNVESIRHGLRPM